MEDYNRLFLQTESNNKYLKLLFLTLGVIIFLGYMNLSLKTGISLLLSINGKLLLLSCILNVLLLIYLNRIINNNYSQSQNLDKLKSEFINTVSHELRTPITSISILMFLLRKKLTNSFSGQEIYYLDRAQKQIQRLSRVLLEMFEMTGLERGNKLRKEQFFTVNDLLIEAVDEMQFLNYGHKLYIDSSYQGKIQGDRNKLKQTVISLIDNALRYSPPGPVFIKCRSSSRKVFISVKDFGCGIPPQFQEKIFKKFYQITQTKKKDDPGLGLGLYLSNEIVKLHGGRLWVDSVEGKGSTFYFSLPLRNHGLHFNNN